MITKKALGIVALCCFTAIVVEANSWDQYVTIKPVASGSNQPTAVTPPATSQPTSAPSYNRYVTQSQPAPTPAPTQQRVEPPPAPIVQAPAEPVYQPEIVPPYQPPTVASTVPVQQQTREQAEQQLLVQQSQQEDNGEWGEYSGSYSSDFSMGSSDKTYSQWFDNDIRPVYYFRGGLIEETQFGSYGVTEIAIADLRARLFKVSDFLPGGSLDAWLFADGMYFIDNPGMSALPDGLLAAGLDIGLWWRFTNGFSWELRGAPGIYSDPTAPEFSCTGTLNLHYTVSESFCFVLGATYRPEWDMEIYPNIGFIWQPSDLLRVHAALPESRVDLFPRHIFNFFATFAWDNTTYWLDNEESLPGTVTFDAMRASVGATITFFDNLELSAEIGTHLKHELKGDVKGEDTIDLDKTTFIRATIGNRF